MDTMLIYNTNMQGNIVDFDDDNEIVTILRINDNPSTMFKDPFELQINSYENIQAMSICASNKTMNDALDTLSTYIPTKVDKMKEMLKTSPASNTYMATPSTVNVTDRVGSKPQMYRTDEYGSAGEKRINRKTNPLEPIKTIVLNEDGSLPDDTESSSDDGK
jgi:hypothetical protein